MDVQGITNVLIVAVIYIVIILFSLSVHEFAHAYVANIFGDPTAKIMGRLSINPLRHWDSIGTSLLVGTLILASFGVGVPVFGWGKPVPVDERNFENPRLYGFQTAIAGPMSNFVLAVIIAIIARFVHLPDPAAQFLTEAVYLNIFLMFFNLIPVPPLDGSRILRLFLPDEWYARLNNNPYTMIFLLILVFYFLIGILASLSQHLTVFLLHG